MKNRMSNRVSIDDHFEDFEATGRSLKRTMKAGDLGFGAGFVAGVVGGIFLGESINDYFEVLKQAPIAIHYAVDAASAVVCGVVGAGTAGTIALLPGVYKHIKRL
jgi:hypothetical protein